LDYWCRAAFWTIDEGVALSFGKSPAAVNSVTMARPAKASRFADVFRRAFELARRACVTEQLRPNSPPGEFLAWAQRTGFTVDPRLLAFARSQGVVIEDANARKDRFALLSAERDDLRRQLDAANDAISRLRRRRLVGDGDGGPPLTDEDEAALACNLPAAVADIEHWSRASFWTLDEAVALTLGRDPRRVNWESINGLTGISKLGKRYEALRDLVERAKTACELTDPTSPSAYLNWTSMKRIEVASEVASAVAGMRADGQDKVAQATPAPPSESPVGTRERDSLYKLIIGMAFGGYGFRPATKRGDTVPEIIRDLDQAGVSLSADTVRKYLRAAADLLPPQTDEP
jgi:hypothetical protein